LRDRWRERGYKQGQRERERRGGVKRGGHDVHNKYKANREEQKKRTGAARQSVSQKEVEKHKTEGRKRDRERGNNTKNRGVERERGRWGGVGKDQG